MTRLFLILVLIAPLASFSMSKKNKTHKKQDGEVEVIIEGGTFKPDVIGVSSKKASKVSFIMRDDKLCKEKVVIKHLNVEVPISMGKKSSIVLKGKKPGKYHMECETGAFCGVLIVLGGEEDEPKHYYAPHPE